MHDCLIAFGSNEGDSKTIFENAVHLLAESQGLRVSEVSMTHQTTPVGGPENQEPYLNAAIRIETRLSVFDVHHRIAKIETELGRQRRQRWGSRRIDLDLLLFDQQQINTDNLIVPHPRMSFRRFVLQPALEIAADMVHVTSGRTISQLVSRLDASEKLILCVCPASQNRNVAKVRCKVPLDWSLRVVNDETEFEKHTPWAKLVSYFQESTWENELGLFQTARAFSGPTVQLSCDLEATAVELMAAIQAMK